MTNSRAAPPAFLNPLPDSFRSLPGYVSANAPSVVCKSTVLYNNSMKNLVLKTSFDFINISTDLNNSSYNWYKNDDVLPDLRVRFVMSFDQQTNQIMDFLSKRFNEYQAGLMSVEGSKDVGLFYNQVFDTVDNSSARRNPEDAALSIEKFDKIMSDVDKAKYKYRAHYSQDDYGLFVNNRGGNIDWLGFDDSDVESLKGKPCHYPFYKLFVDWNGDVLFCSNDWGKEIVVGNLVKEKLFDVWFSDKMYDIRKKLSKGDRDFSPCKNCSVNGQLFGKESFNIINEYYENINNK